MNTLRCEPALRSIHRKMQNKRDIVKIALGDEQYETVIDEFREILRRRMAADNCNVTQSLIACVHTIRSGLTQTDRLELMLLCAAIDLSDEGAEQNRKTPVQKVQSGQRVANAD